MAGQYYPDPRPFYFTTSEQKLSFLADCFPQKNKYIVSDLVYHFEKVNVTQETIQPVATNPKIQTIQLKVNLNCAACERKVKKALEDVAGIENVTFDQENNIVFVKGTMKPEVVLKKVKKVKPTAALKVTKK